MTDTTWVAPPRARVPHWGPDDPTTPRPPRKRMPRRRRAARPSWPRVILLAVPTVLLAVLLARLGPGRHGDPPKTIGIATATASARGTATAQAVPTAAPRPTATPTPDPAPPALMSQLHGIIDPLAGSYDIYVEDLTTGARFGINADHQSIAASVIKLPIAISLLEAQSEGTVDLATKVTPRPDEIQDYGTGSIRYDAPGTSYTIQDLLTRLIKQSDNTAAVVLTDLLGQDKIQQRIDAWGLSQTSLKDDTSTPADIGKLLVMLYEHKVLSPKQSLDLMGLMTNTDFEDRLPQPLPKYVQVAHKIGTEAHGVVNDAAIVVLPGHPYVICVFSDGTAEDEATPALQKISQAVFDYESSLP